MTVGIRHLPIILSLFLTNSACTPQSGGAGNSPPKLTIKSLPAAEDGEVISFAQIPEGSYQLHEIHFNYKSDGNAGGNMKHTFKRLGIPEEGDPVEAEKFGSFANFMAQIPLAIHSREKDVVLDDLRSYYGYINEEFDWQWKLYERGTTYEPNLGRILEQNKKETNLYKDIATPFVRTLGIQMSENKITLSFVETDDSQIVLKARLVYLKDEATNPEIESLVLKKTN